MIPSDRKARLPANKNISRAPTRDQADRYYASSVRGRGEIPGPTRHHQTIGRVSIGRGYRNLSRLTSVFWLASLHQEFANFLLEVG
jgi:hypothetical protein